jgi:hypothetical protein
MELNEFGKNDRSQSESTGETANALTACSILSLLQKVLDRGTPRVGQEDMQIFRSRLRSLVAEARSKGISPGRIAAELNSLAEVLLQ